MRRARLYESEHIAERAAAQGRDVVVPVTDHPEDDRRRRLCARQILRVRMQASGVTARCAHLSWSRRHNKNQNLSRGKLRSASKS